MSTAETAPEAETGAQARARLAAERARTVERLARIESRLASAPANQIGSDDLTWAVRKIREQDTRIESLRHSLGHAWSAWLTSALDQHLPSEAGDNAGAGESVLAVVLASNPDLKARLRAALTDH